MIMILTGSFAMVIANIAIGGPNVNKKHPKNSIRAIYKVLSKIFIIDILKICS